MTMIMRLERTSEEVKTRARHVIICDNYPEKHRSTATLQAGLNTTRFAGGDTVITGPCARWETVFFTWLCALLEKGVLFEKNFATS